MPPRVAGLTGATLETAPSVCHECVWWQSRVAQRRQASLGREGGGGMGGVGDGLLRRRRAPARLDAVRAVAALSARGRAAGGPPLDRTRCSSRARTSSTSTPWVMQSLFLAAIGDARDRGAKALEAFAYRYPEGESSVRALSRAPDGVPVGLPRRLRLPDGARAGARRAGPPRARRPRLRCSRASAPACCGR